jgi:hypothetical protein
VVCPQTSLPIVHPSCFLSTFTTSTSFQTTAMPQLHGRSFLLPAILLASLARAQSSGTITQEITTLAAFSQQKPCARSCFQTGGALCPADILGAHIGCARTDVCESISWQARNNCYCSSGLQIPAQEFLSSCISRACSVADVFVDVSSAVSIYSRYCGDKGYVAGAPASNPATVTNSKSPPSATSTGGSTPSAEATSGSGGTGSSSNTPGSPSITPGSSSNTPGSSKLSVGSIVGIVVGSCAGLLLIAVAMWIFWKLFAPFFRGKQLPEPDRALVHVTPLTQPPYHLGPPSEVGWNESVSMVGGLAPPPPTFVSNNPLRDRWA